MKEQVPDVVIQRLPMYAHILRALKDVGVESIGSRELGAMLRTTPAQIRKDLSYFGKFGKQGMGYDVGQLLEEVTLQIQSVNHDGISSSHEVRDFALFENKESVHEFAVPSLMLDYLVYHWICL